jgi:hypothetical protein
MPEIIGYSSMIASITFLSFLPRMNGRAFKVIKNATMILLTVVFIFTLYTTKEILSIEFQDGVVGLIFLLSYAVFIGLNIYTALLVYKDEITQHKE